ncbi:MAG: DUF2189 domain-containing protein [Alphaproteobacteria bacterium]
MPRATFDHQPEPRRSNGIVLADITMEAPWRWLATGWHDLRRRPGLSLGYGLVLTTTGLAMAGLAWVSGYAAIIPAAAGAFMLVAPILALGLYEMSRHYAQDATFTLKDILGVKPASPLQLFYIGFGLMFLVLVWVRLASLLFAVFASGSYSSLSDFMAFLMSTPSGLALLVVGSLVGAVLAFVVFAVSAISVPMLLDRDIDFMTAILTSIRAVRQNPGPMLLWAWIIAVFTGAGLAAGFVGLVVVFPLIGHATWHAYRELTSPSPSF